MSLKTITRIKAADLQQVQTQANVTNSGTIANVIQSLQFNKSQSATLNTSCPTCVVNGNPTGFVTSGSNIVPCPTCKGYLLYHTIGGVLTPPTNPFNAPLVVKRLLPADLVQLVAGFPSATTLDTMITAMQGNYTNPLTNNCPNCTHTGWIGSGGTKTYCPLCVGMQKTARAYTITNGKPILVSPTVTPPDPLPTPPNPYA